MNATHAAPTPPRRPPFAPLVCVGLAATLATAFAQTTPVLTRGPYLQFLTPHSVTIVWQTDLAAACTLTIRRLDGSPTTLVRKTATTCVIAVDGLSPGTSYAYIPRADSAPLATESVFKTDDPTSDRFTFLVVGDHGDHNSSTQLPVRDRMVATPADFIISTGDMIYPDGAPEDFNPKFFVPYADLIRHLVFWPCIGNHDDHGLDGAPWRDAFWTPANNPERDEDYYSFDYANAHIVVVESNKDPMPPGSAQYEFLDRELTNTTARWKFVVWHHPVYSSGTTHGSSLDLRSNLVPLLDAHAVDMVFTGHEHNYERTYPLYDGAIVPPGRGTVYFVTGGGGADLTPLGPLSAVTAAGEVAFHFVRVAVDGDTLRADMIRTDGTIGDSVTLVKPGGTTTTSVPTTTTLTTATIPPTTTTLASCSGGVLSCWDNNPCTVDACDAGSGSCTHTTIPDCCRTDADCDDEDECTLDRCGPTQICEHQAVHFQVGTVLDPALGVGACRNDRVPRAIAHLLGQASRLAERASRQPKRTRIRSLLRLAMHKIEAGRRKARLAGSAGHISSGCAAGLDTLIAESWARPGECLARAALR